MTKFLSILKPTLICEKLQHNQISKLLLFTQALGGVLFAVVCAAYFFGLRATSSYIVLHSERTYRVAIGSVGCLFLVTTIAMLLLAYKISRQIPQTPRP